MAAKTSRGTRSISDEHAPRGKHFAADGRKVKDLPRVGAMSPDADPDEPERALKPRRRPTARR